MKQEWNKKRVVPPGIEIPGIPARKLVKAGTPGDAVRRRRRGAQLGLADAINLL